MMRQIFVTQVVLVLLATGFSCHTAKTATGTKRSGTWQSSPIVIDGYNNDWPKPYPFADTSALVRYNISNDIEKIYVTLETNDTKTQMKILKAGMRLWVDTAGAQGMRMAIHFPLTPVKAELPSGRFKSESTDREKRMQQRVKMALEEVKQISLEGFPGCSDTYEIIKENSCGIKARVAIDSNDNLVWEASIPFKAIYGKDRIDKTYGGKDLGIGFSIGSFEKPQMLKNLGDSVLNNQRTRDSNTRTSNAAARYAEMKHLFTPTNTWKQVGIAYKAN